jgi:hypothetical protein
VLQEARHAWSGSIHMAKRKDKQFAKIEIEIVHSSSSEDDSSSSAISARTSLVLLSTIG